MEQWGDQFDYRAFHSAILNAGALAFAGIGKALKHGILQPVAD